MPDLTINDQGSIVLIEPNTDTAREWLTEHVDIPDWAWLGRGFACDHRAAGPLIEGAVDAGLTVG